MPIERCSAVGLSWDVTPTQVGEYLKVAQQYGWSQFEVGGYAPGTPFPEHQHGPQYYMILAGSFFLKAIEVPKDQRLQTMIWQDAGEEDGVVLVKDREYPLNPGDRAVVRRYIHHEERAGPDGVCFINSRARLVTD